MLIGLDFDNTIAGYDAVFNRAAVREGLLSTSEALTKQDVRAAVRARPDGDREWMRLQGRVYGAHMGDATLIDGVGAFLTTCRAKGLAVCIISHKTEYGHFDPDRINLRDAARSWMAAQGFFDAAQFGLSPEMVIFEPTRAEKVQRIGAMGCTHFVDDLEEVFSEPDFPRQTRQYLYAPGEGPLPVGAFRAFRHWADISHELLGT